MINNCNFGAPRLLTALYQSGEKVGVAAAIKPSADSKTVVLTNVHIGGVGIDVTAPFELQNVRITCPELAKIPAGSGNIGIAINGDTTCAVLGPR